MGLHVVVLLKQVLDPEIPASRFKIDPATKRPVEGIASEVLGPYERNALEVALQLKDAGGADKVTALAAGSPSFQESLRKALSVRADEAVLVDVGDAGELEPWQTATVLARAIQKLGNVDVVIAGRQAGDWDHGQVGLLVAEQLGWPCVGFVQRARAENGHLRLERERSGVREVLTSQPPVVLTITNDDSNVLRMARVQDLMKARRQPITTWGLGDLGLAPADLKAAAATEILDLRIPQRESKCEFIAGDDPHEVARQLVKRLRELKLL
ncbi:MAG TPA: electron transfer flavoprotein subunit beta/FixA family protein [Bacillota bacterium]